MPVQGKIIQEEHWLHLICNQMNKVITLTVSYNYFGDTVLNFLGEEFSIFQHNCRRAKELLKRVQTLIRNGYVCLIVEEDYNLITIKPAAPYIEDAIKSDEEAYQAYGQYKYNDSPGAEIAGRYGY